MKPEFDKEMDSLLRAHARRGGAHAATADAHLDADELSAYAERALPESARARYSAHLADCDGCRAQVVLLARAAGVAERMAERGAVTVATQAPSWRARLAALFAPGAWRYALPVIALLLVGGVVLRVMNSARLERANTAQSNTQVATTARPNEVAEQHHEEAAPQQNGPSAQTGGFIATDDSAQPSAESDDRAKSAAVTAKDTPRDMTARNEAPLVAGAGAAAPAAAPVPQPTPAAALRPQPKLGDFDTLAGAANQSAGANQSMTATQSANRGLNSQNAQQSPPVGQYAPEPPANAKSALPTDKEAQAREQAKAPATRAAERGRADDAVALDKREAKRDEGARRAEEDERVHGPQRSMGAARARGAAKAAPKDEEAVRVEERKEKANKDRAATNEAAGEETRTVGVREFRRLKGAWVDTAYRAGQATTVVRRNSEQWRALVADEPELRRIADALGGEVVIVWRGRAYRIK